MNDGIIDLKINFFFKIIKINILNGKFKVNYVLSEEEEN